MWEFVAQNPAWGIGYLVVICFTVTMVSAQWAQAWRKAREAEWAEEEVREALSESPPKDETS